MANFPKLLSFLDPWKKTHFFFMNREAPSANAENLPAWKESLLLIVEQADIRDEDETALIEEIQNFQANTKENKEQFELRMRHAISRKEVIKRSGESVGDLTNEVITLNDPLVFLENNDGEALSRSSAAAQLEQGVTFTVNYGIGEKGVNQTKAKQAQRRIGLHHIFASQQEVTKIEVTNTTGTTTVLVRCPDGKYRAEGQLTKKKHYAVYQNYKVKVLEIGGKNEEQKMDAVAAEMKREEAATQMGLDALNLAQRTEAERAEARTEIERLNNNHEALVNSGIITSAAPNSIKSPLTPAEDQEFNEASTKLTQGMKALIENLFSSEGRQDSLNDKCTIELENKKFKSITYKSMEGLGGNEKEGSHTQGQMQEITLTLIDKKGVEHIYKGVSNQPIGENALVEENIPALIQGAKQVKNYYWNREAFKDLIKNVAAQSGGEIPHPVMDSPYANGVIFGAVRPAGTTGEEGGSEKYKPSKVETGNARLSPNLEGDATGDTDINMIHSLKTGEGARLPDAMHSWTIRDFEANKYRVDHMDQFWDSLTVLAKESGRTQMELLKTFLDGNKITYQELTRQVYGRTPERVWEDFAEARDALAYQRDYSNLHPGETPPVDSDKSSVKKRDLAGEEKDEYYTYAELKELVKRRRDFFVASYRLLEAARVLEKNNAVVRSDAQGELGPDAEEVTHAKGVIAAIFDPKDKAPVAKRTLGEILFHGDEDFEASMDQTQRSYLMEGENAYETSISSSAAYALLLGEFTEGEHVNYEGLAARLNQMRASGYLYYEIMGEKDQSRLLEAKGETAVSLSAAKNADPIRADDLKKLPDGGLKPADILLIQLGMIPQTEMEENEQETVQMRAALRKVQEEADRETSAAVKEIDELRQKYGEKGFTPDEIEAYEKAVLSQMCVRMNEKGQFGLVFADMNADYNSDVGVGGSKTLLSVPVGNKGNLTISAGVGVGFISGITVLDGLAAGANVAYSHQFGEQSQNTVSVGAGVSGGIGHVEAGVMASVKLKGTTSAEVPARVWYFKAGVGAVAGAGFENGGVSLRVANIEIGRDIDMAARKKYQKLKETNSDFDTELSNYVENMVEANQAQIDANTEGLSRLEKAQFLHMFRASIAQEYIKERGEEAIDEMFPIQFGHIGVGLGVGVSGFITGFAVPYFGIELKGRKIVRYMKPAGSENMDAIAEAKFREQLAAETADARMGEVVYQSGDLTTSESGERTLEGSLLSFEQARSLETLNAKLKAQGMELVPDRDAPSKLKMKVSGVDGYVNIYVDPTSQIQVNRGSDNYPYLNLDFNDALSILRVDNYTAFKDGGGGVKNVDIYITDNPQKSIQSIKDRTGDRITWRQTDIYPADSGRNTLEGAMHVTRNTYTETSAAFASEAALTSAGYEQGDFNSTEAKEKRESLQAQMEAALGIVEISQELPRVEQLDAIVQQLIASKSVSYMELTSKPKATQEVIATAEAKMGEKLNGDERTYLLQCLLVESRAKNPGSTERMSRHILGWNTKALEAFCTQHGMNAETAQMIMTTYNKKLGDRLGGDLPSTTMEKGYAFHTLIGQGEIGTLGRGINSSHPSNLAGMEDVTVENLTANFGLTTEQAKAFLDAQLREFRYMDSPNSTPDQKMKSPMGIALLEQAVYLFEPQTVEFLIHARTSGDIDTDSPHWDAFAKALHALETTGTYVASSGSTLMREQHVVMGFLESCRNFTVAAKEEVSTRNLVAVHGVDTYQGLTGNVGNNFTTADVAAATTPQEKPKGEKAGNSDISSEQGDGRSDQAGDGGHTGEEAPRGMY